MGVGVVVYLYDEQRHDRPPDQGRGITQDCELGPEPRQDCPSLEANEEELPMNRRTTFRGSPAQARSARRYWGMVAVNLACCLIFTALLIWFGSIIFHELDNRTLAHCETITTEVDDNGLQYSFRDG